MGGNDSDRSLLIPRYIETEDWYVSCGPCEVATALSAAAAAWRAARLPRFRGRTLHIQSFLRHNRSVMRRTACKVGGDKEVIDAPSLKEFEAAWEVAAGS
jgi:hypothetical protein